MCARFVSKLSSKSKDDHRSVLIRDIDRDFAPYLHIHCDNQSAIRLCTFIFSFENYRECEGSSSLISC